MSVVYKWQSLELSISSLPCLVCLYCLLWFPNVLLFVLSGVPKESYLSLYLGNNIGN